MSKRTKETIKATAAGAGAGGSALGVVAALGIPGLSGPGIMTGLAAAGLGSAAGGLVVIGVGASAIGYGIYKGIGALLDD